MTIQLGNTKRSLLKLQVQSLIFLSWVFLSTEKACSSGPSYVWKIWRQLYLQKRFYSTAWSRSAFANRIVSKFFKRGKEEYAFSVDKKSKTIALQYLGQKSSKLGPKPLVRKLVSQNFSTIFGFSSIFDQLLLFDHKQICIWPLELSEHYDPGNHSKNQQKKTDCETAWM